MVDPLEVKITASAYFGTISHVSELLTLITVAAWRSGRRILCLQQATAICCGCMVGQAAPMPHGHAGELVTIGVEFRSMYVAGKV